MLPITKVADNYNASTFYRILSAFLLVCIAGLVFSSIVNRLIADSTSAIVFYSERLTQLVNLLIN